MAAVLLEDEAHGVRGIHGEAELAELELGHDLGTDHVRNERARRPLRTGNQLLGHAGAPKDVARLEGEDLNPARAR